MPKRTKYIALTILIFLITLLSYIGYLIFQHGTIYQMDVTDGLSIKNLIQRYLFSYSNDTSEPLTLAEKARLPLFSIIFTVYKFSTLIYNSSDNYVKVKILLLFLITFTAFFVYTFKLLNLVFEKESRNKHLIGTALASFFFILNYWFTNRITHFGLFFTTALIPIAFYYLYKFFLTESGQFKDLLKLSCFLFFLTGTPHSVLMFGVLFFTCFFIALFIKPKRTVSKLSQIFIFGVIVIAISAFWLAPFLASNSRPDAILNKTIVQTINKNTHFPNSLLLKGYWLASEQDYYAQPTKTIQEVIAWFPILLLITTLITYRKNKTVFLSLLLLAIFSLFLSTSSPITDGFYDILMFKLSFQGFGWLLREYDKFGVLVAYTYALSIALLFVKARKKPLIMGTTVAYALVLFSSFAYLNDTLHKHYTPVVIPDDFSTINNELHNDSTQYNVVWYPGVPTPTWSKSKEVRYIFSNLVSEIPTVTQSSEVINYIENLFEKDQLLSVDLGNALNLIGVKYLVIRKDFEPAGFAEQINHYLALQQDLAVVKETPLLTLYINKEYTGLVKTYSSRIATNLGLNILQKFPPYSKNTLNEYIDYTDKPSMVESKFPTTYVGDNSVYLDAEFSKLEPNFIYPYKHSIVKEDGNSGMWKTGSLENLTHAELNFFLPQLGLNIKQFDFSNGVVIARDGWQKSNINDRGKELNLAFARQNVVFNNELLNYVSSQDDLKEYWNINRSTTFDVEGTKALEISLDENIDENLTPHYKITFYDNQNFVLDTQALYTGPDRRLRAIVKLPEGSKTADFSVWTLSTAQGYSYQVKGLRLADVTNNVEAVKLAFKERISCLGDCILYVRTLASQIGGKLAITVNDTSFGLDTKLTNDDEDPVYKWIRLGLVSDLGQVATFELKNLEGFNSINAFVLITKEQENNIVATSEIHKNSPVPYNAGAQTISVKQLNPTLYELDVINDIKQPLMLTFAKPFSKNWRFSASVKTPQLVNGYINGWYLTELKNGKYYISHKPQSFYVAGLAISGITFVAIATYLLMSAKVVTKSAPTSKSQG